MWNKAVVKICWKCVPVIWWWCSMLETAFCFNFSNFPECYIKFQEKQWKWSCAESILVVFVKAAWKCKTSIYLKIAALNKNLWELVIMRHPVHARLQYFIVNFTCCVNVKSPCCEFKERNVWHFCMIQSTWTTVGGLNAINFQMLISSWLLRLLCSRACMECIIKFKPQWLLASPYQDWEISEMGMLITLTKTTYMLIYLLHNLTLPNNSFFIISSTFPKLWCVFLCTL